MGFWKELDMDGQIILELGLRCMAYGCEPDSRRSGVV